MKDLIVIGAYCPDKERENLLNRCVDSIQNIRGDFDIMISSHSIIPEYITQKVDYVFFDKNNKIITDWKYLNQPWFCPTDNITIKSFVKYFSLLRVEGKLTNTSNELSEIIESITGFENDTIYRYLSEHKTHLEKTEMLLPKNYEEKPKQKKSRPSS